MIDQSLFNATDRIKNESSKPVQQSLIYLRGGQYDLKFVSLCVLVYMYKLLMYKYFFYSDGIISRYYKNRRDTPFKSGFYLFSLD